VNRTVEMICILRHINMARENTAKVLEMSGSWRVILLICKIVG